MLSPGIMRHLLLLSLLLASSADAKSPPAVEATAKRFAQHINAGESGKAAALIDVDAIVDRAVDGISVPKDFTTGLRKGFKPAIDKFAGELSETVEGGGSFTLLRMRAREGKELSLFRLLSAEGGLNYIEVEWRSRDGLVRGVDIEPAMSGEPMSASLRRGAAGFAAKNKLIDRLSGKQKAHLQGINASARFVASAQSGNSEEAMSLYRALPAEQQREKLNLVNRMIVAQAISEDEYLKAMEDMIRHHPQDPATLLASVDLWFLKKEFGKVRGIVEKLDARVGGDPYLEVIRANTLIAEEKFEEAKKVLQRGVAKEPTLTDAWFVLVDLSINQNTHAETARLLDAATKSAGVEWSGIPDAEHFAGFRASKEGKAWLSRLPKAPAPASSPAATDTP